MIMGVGIDLVDKIRMGEMVKRQPRLIQRILTESEQSIMPSIEHRQLEFIAGRFAAKEAASKALGTGIGKACGFHDLEILKNDQGKPFINIAERVLQTCYPEYRPDQLRLHVSISHERAFAIAQIIIEAR